MVKEGIYCQIFVTKFNLSFGNSKSDRCSTCDSGSSTNEHEENYHAAFEAMIVDRQAAESNDKVNSRPTTNHSVTTTKHIKGILFTISMVLQYGHSCNHKRMLQNNVLGQNIKLTEVVQKFLVHCLRHWN